MTGLPLDNVLLFVLMLVFYQKICSAFLTSSNGLTPTFTAAPLGTSSRSTCLFGISEWRSSTINQNRTILLLPVEQYQAPLLPGQTKTLLLPDKSSLESLETAVKLHAGILGAIIRQKGEKGKETLLSVFPLCEIKQCSSESSGTTSVTLKCMGRAQLVDIEEQKLQSTLLKGFCFELKDSKNEEKQVADSCNEISQDIEQILATQKSLNAVYQQAFWQALTALGYNPTCLLTRDPAKTNSQKEIQAASWAGLAACGPHDDDNLYPAFASTSTLERLQFVRRHLLAQTLERAQGSSVTNADKDGAAATTSLSRSDEDGMNDLDGLGFFQ